ncbi:hypothetical protein O181_102163 [Austropuccinia psidii MF-1]|uniref:Endonuclease/exonuclease/phosphatase domain-containing protein n=1 Tax=Austropuccinia psidii MF-1 TaxID=1389203 RepID=A0A9Q3JFV4_9BASI|nr:hypothetical protein [Austropuccinia psidii MF-1]
MKGSQHPQQQRIQMIGSFSETRVSLIPTAKHNKISILQLNCHNRKDTMLSLLNTKQENLVLLIQEPWVYHHNLKPPTHNAWRRITANITIGEDNNKLLTSISINLGEGKKLTLKSLYNAPTTFEAINVLNNTLSNNNPQSSPTIIAMDSNLHSKLWNPRGYNHIHPQAKDHIRICSSKGFNLCSPKGTPTFT